jgi:AcrR family transcriptional regulator
MTEPASVSPPASELNDGNPAPAPRRSRPVNRREQILDVAESHFSRLGFGATTLQTIAEEVGVRVASLYNHFSSKNALYAAVLERALAPVRDLLDGALSGPQAGHTGPGLMVAFADLYAEHPAIVRLFQHEMLAGDERMHPLMREWIEQLTRTGRDHLRELYVGPGRWSEESIPLLQLAMFNVVGGYFTAAPLHRLMTGRDVSSSEALAQQKTFVRRLERALANLQLDDDNDERDDERDEKKRD